MSKHTTGPWFFDEEMGVITTQSRRKACKTCIATVDTDWIGPFAEEQEANARLIEAAPDLLDALQTLDSLWAENEKCGVDFAFAIEKARDAISKATGGEQ